MFEVDNCGCFKNITKTRLAIPYRLKMNVYLKY